MNTDTYHVAGAIVFTLWTSHFSSKTQTSHTMHLIFIVAIAVVVVVVIAAAV